MTLDKERIGRKAIYTGFSGNAFLTIFNFVIGTLSGSTALVVESAHTLSDILTTIIAFIGFKLGLKPADKEHPYGHGRAEPMVSLLIVVFLLFISYEIFSQVYYKLTLGSALKPPDLLAAGMAIVGIIVNYVMARYLLRIGHKINSPAIIADANHQKVDIFSCGAVLVGVIGANVGFPLLDPLVGGLVGVLVLKTAFDVAKDNVNHLMGTVPSDEIIDDIVAAAESIEGVYNPHKIKVNHMGPYASVELHIKVKDDLLVKDAHRIAHSVQQTITEEITIIDCALVHVCPIHDEYENHD